jgi:hypothetical protein
LAIIGGHDESVCIDNQGWSDQGNKDCSHVAENRTADLCGGRFAQIFAGNAIFTGSLFTGHEVFQSAG